MSAHSSLTTSELLDLKKILDYAMELNQKYPIIVEGKHDENILRDLGFEGEIIVFNRGISMVNFAGEIALKYRTVILMFDWDEKGDAMYDRLKTLFLNEGVSVNGTIRRRLRQILGSRISSIEELAFLL